MNQTNRNAIPIVTVESPNRQVLWTITRDFALDELDQARDVANKLRQSLKPHLPAAGLAAPQIGISRSIFIYSYDRAPEHLEIAINPSYTPLGETTTEGWEGCFSSILCTGTHKIAKVSRYQAIKATYLNGAGEQVEKVLEGLGARVFQHEYDHLQGIENSTRSDATVKAFSSHDELMEFLAEVKKTDCDL